MLENGTILDGRYQILAQIGKGGTGIIYKAYYLSLQKYVVVKKIKTSLVDRVNVRGEADILKKLHHTCLPQVYDFLQIGREIYTVMDYIEGYELKAYIEQGYYFPEEQLRLWLGQFCDVLVYLHSQNPPILHSDIKPENIMITPQGNICLIDFNISFELEDHAKLLGMSDFYAAPEQYQKAMASFYDAQRIRLDGRMDIYSMGAVFYRMMTGRLPNPQGNYIPVEQCSLSYSEELVWFVAKAMQRNPKDRFQDAQEMQRAYTRMKKLLPEYRRLRMVQLLAAGVSAVCLGMGIACCFHGVELKVREAWKEDRDKFLFLCETGGELEAVAYGIGILNDSDYAGLLERSPEQKETILRNLGDCYFEMEQYTEAADFYEEAFLADGEETCQRDQVVALARADRVEEALAVFSQMSSGQHSAENLILKGELALAQKHYEDAGWMVQEVLEKSSDREATVQAWLLQAKICQELSDWSGQEKAWEQICALDARRSYLREWGQAAVTCAQQQNREHDAEIYYEKAKSVYEKLLADEAMSSYSEKLNYAIVLRALGKLTESQKILDGLTKSHPERYEAYLWMCMNYIRLNQEGRLEHSYEICLQLYKERQDTDENMELLKSLMEER